MSFKKIIFIPILMAITSCGNNVSNGSSSNDTIVTEFDSENIVFSAPLISDEHIGYSDATVNNKERLDYAFKTLKQFHPNQFDAVLSCGDQTQNGTEENVADLMEVYNQNFDLSKTPFIFSHGNHDTYWTGCMSVDEFYNAYGEDVYTYDLDQTQAKLGNRHVKINGIHIFTVQIKTYMPNYNDLTSLTVEWLEENLANATLDTPNMPIFVLCHSPAKNTIYGSFSEQDTGDWGASTQLDEILSKYSNVTLFSGHTHYGITDDRVINQTTYTQMNLGSVCDLDLDVNFADTKELPNQRQYGFASILEVDKWGNSRITRYDIMKREKIKNSFIIPSPKEDGSHLIKYSYENRIANNVEPSFKENGQFIIKKSSTNTIELEFDAFDEDDMIFAYEMRLYSSPKEDIVDDNDYILSYVVMDDWYNYPTPKQGKVNIVTKTAYSDKYTVKLFAYDSFGGVGSAFTTN